jgi:hypothetical protein
MKPGEGYMLYRQRAGEASFVYPYFEPNATFFEEAGRRASAYSNTMSLTAVAEGIEVQEGDRLVAYAGGETVGESVVSGLTADIPQPLFFLSIAGDRKAPLSFAIERDGDIIATTGDVMTYEVNAVSGSYAVPTSIRFARVEQSAQQGWYTMQGIKLDRKPTQSGVYIHNGRKQMIK